MSRLSKETKKRIERQALKPAHTVENFMGGSSYKLDPLTSLRLIACSSIFGEPSYYRNSGMSREFDSTFVSFSDIPEIEQNDIFSRYNGKSTTEVFTESIDNSLSYDFEGTLKFAVELRNQFFMRLNPQIIMVRAALHPNRKEFTRNNPGKFAEYNNKVMSRADEPVVQMTYYLYNNDGNKNNIPSVIKRSWADKLSSLDSYAVNKYKNHEIGMINAVRLCHANSSSINELMKNGLVYVSENEETWEQKRSRGMSWKEIYDTTNIGHMALLRNIRGVFSEVEDREFCIDYMAKLKKGVLKGKQFPFRYSTAYAQIKKSSCNHKNIILDALEECIDIAIDNLPKLKGKTAVLSDNSGSAWADTVSAHNNTSIAEVDNLSGVLAALCSDEGHFFSFGDKLVETPILKRNGALSQANAISERRGYDVGHATEGGIWIFFRDAIKNKTYYDNIFIFSDMQAGTGGLYGTAAQKKEYMSEYSCVQYSLGERNTHRTYFPLCEYINVFKLVLEYRQKVNPKVNVFTVQTAGYNTNLVPNMSYRCGILTGWTGNEIEFAKRYIDEWDRIESKSSTKVLCVGDHSPIKKVNDSINSNDINIPKIIL